MFTRIKQKITFIITPLVLIGVVAFSGSMVSAATCDADTSKGEICCGGTVTSIIGGDVCKGATDGGTGDKSAIWAILILVLNILTAGVGVAAVGGIVYGAILYSSAGDKQDQTKKAISVIANVVIGIIAYAFMYLILNFLIPGGIFS